MLSRGVIAMTQADFDALADSALEQIALSLDGAAPDLDVESKGDGMIEIGFDDGSKIIVNRHRAAEEIWVAARAGGFHFRWDGATWRDTRDGAELFAALSRLVSAQGGVAVVLSPRR